MTRAAGLDSILLSIHEEAGHQLALAHALHCGATYGFALWFKDRIGFCGETTVDCFRRDFRGVRGHPEFFKYKMLFDGVSEESYKITPIRFCSNAHDAAFTFYRVTLNELWRVLRGDDPDLSRSLEQELDIDRLAEHQRAICEAFKEELTLDFRRLSSQLEREIASLLKHQALLPATGEPTEHARERPVAAVSLGNGKYRVGDEPPFVVDDACDCVLVALIENGGAAGKDELVKTSGRQDAPRLLRNTRRKYPALAPHIIMPGSKGKGGYRTTICKA